MIKGVIFDIDGVLLDSMIIWTDLGERYLKSISAVPEEGLMEKLFSMSMEQGAQYLKDTYNIDKSIPTISISAVLDSMEHPFDKEGVAEKTHDKHFK